MDDVAWIWAAVAVGSGLLFGEIAGRLARTTMRRRSAGSPSTAERVASLIFWISTAVGLVLAVAIADEAALDDLGDRLGESIPRLLIAVVVVIGGYVVSIALAAAVGQSARSATGVRQRTLERTLQAAVVAASVVVVLAELGVDGPVLVVLVAVAVGAPAFTLALLSVLGGRDVAQQIAAGRALRHRVIPGSELRLGDVAGIVVALHPTSVELEDGDGRRILVPNSSLIDGPVTLYPPR